ncbi:MAG: hypothetical protein GC185_04730 [Alphaproteobacteria bacterium]|nr:hypothetical protein [Alphaproteobacteria bacterium]
MTVKDDFNQMAEDPLGRELLKELGTPRNGASGNAGLEARVMALLEQGAPLDARDGEGMTPLMWASYHCRHRLVTELVARGAKLHDRDNAGKTALDHARAKKQKPAIKILTEAAKKQLDAELADLSVKKPLAIFKQPLQVRRRGR